MDNQQRAPVDVATLIEENMPNQLTGVVVAVIVDSDGVAKRTVGNNDVETAYWEDEGDYYKVTAEYRWENELHHVQLGDAATYLEVGWKYGYQRKLISDRAHSLLYALIPVKDIHEEDSDVLTAKAQMRFIKQRYTKEKAIKIEVHTKELRFRRRLDKIIAWIPKESFNEWLLYHVALKRQQKDKDLKLDDEKDTENTDEEAKDQKEKAEIE